MKRTTAMTLCALALSSVLAGCAKGEADSPSSEIDDRNTAWVTLRAEQENKGSDGAAESFAPGGRIPVRK